MSSFSIDAKRAQNLSYLAGGAAVLSTVTFGLLLSRLPKVIALDPKVLRIGRWVSLSGALLGSVTTVALIAVSRRKREKGSEGAPPPKQKSTSVLRSEGDVTSKSGSETVISSANGPESEGSNPLEPLTAGEEEQGYNDGGPWDGRFLVSSGELDEEEGDFGGGAGWNDVRAPLSLAPGRRPLGPEQEWGPPIQLYVRPIQPCVPGSDEEEEDFSRGAVSAGGSAFIPLNARDVRVQNEQGYGPIEGHVGGAGRADGGAFPHVFNVRDLRALEALGDDLETSDAGFLPLLMAVQRGDVEAVKRWASEETVQQRSACDRTALHYAAMAKGASSASIVQLLLEKGADTRAQDTEGLTPLHLAVQGNLPAVQALLKEDPNTVICSAEGKTCAFYATEAIKTVIIAHREAQGFVLGEVIRERGQEEIQAALDSFGRPLLHRALLPGSKLTALTRAMIPGGERGEEVNLGGLRTLLDSGTEVTHEQLKLAIEQRGAPAAIRLVLEKRPKLNDPEKLLEIAIDANRDDLVHLFKAAITPKLLGRVYRGIEASPPEDVLDRGGYYRRVRVMIKLLQLCEPGGLETRISAPSRARKAPMLYWAFEDGKADVVRALARSGASLRPKLQEEEGRVVTDSLLHAVFSPHYGSARLKLVEALLAGVTEANRKEFLEDKQHKRQVTPLGRAVTAKDSAVVEALLNCGAIVQRRHLERAVKEDDPETLAFLLCHFRPDAKGQLDGLLESAIHAGSEEIAVLLLEAGAEPTLTCVKSAIVKRFDVKTLQLLFEKQTTELRDLKISGFEETPLECALRLAERDSQFYDYIPILATEKQKAAVVTSTVESDSILVRGVLRKNQELLYALIRAEVDFNAEEGKALETAISLEKDSLELAGVLLDGGANPNARGGRLLHRAAYEQKAEMVALLLEFGADPVMVDPKGERKRHVLTLAVLIAAQDQNTSILQAVLEYCIKEDWIDTVDGKNQTALEVAAKEGHEKATRLLLEAGADPKTVSKEALESCNRKIKKLIRSHQPKPRAKKTASSSAFRRDRRKMPLEVSTSKYPG